MRRRRSKHPLFSLRGIAYRALALLIGLLPLILLEAILALLGWGHPVDHEDPFVGFRSITPLFVPSDDGQRYETAPGRLLYFCPDSFAATKPPDEYRVFCLGGSTVFGRPFQIETSFTTWLELSLNAAETERRFEVVNCGGVSYASYRLVPILEEVLNYAPDSIVLYTGHNEFLEDRTYDHIKHMPEVVAWPLRQCARLRTFTLLRSAYLDWTRSSKNEASGDRPVLEGEVDALLDHPGGLEEYHHDEEWRQDVITHFRYNVGRMVAMCREAGVPIIIVTPVSNIRDTPPFKSEHREDLTSAELERWEELLEMARARWGADKQRALELIRRAIAIDGQYAGIHFELGKRLEAMGRFEKARKAYERAKERDVCPLRILSPMRDALEDIAADADVPLVDARKILRKLSDCGIPGGDWLVDHVHPSIEGHKVIAEAIAKTMVEVGAVEPTEGWNERRRKRFEEHFSSLGEFYFVRGRQRLESVRGWARGKVDAEPEGGWIPERMPPNANAETETESAPGTEAEPAAGTDSASATER